MNNENMNFMNPLIFRHHTQLTTWQVVAKIVKFLVALTLVLNTANPPIGILNSFIDFIL